MLGRMAFAAALVIAGGAAWAEDATPPKEAAPAKEAAPQDAAPAKDAAKDVAPAPPVNPKIDVARGDRWTYEVRDDITDELKTILDFAVTDVTDAEIDTRARFTNAVTNAETTAVQVFDPRWRLKDNGVNVWRPALEETGIPADIKVGKTWSYSYDSSRVNPPAHFRFAGKAKVLSYEHVAVANGLAFDAFKIVYDFAVTPVVNNRKFEMHVELWYAPEANRYVKRLYESRQNRKLLEASLETLRDYRHREK